ncbi:MAG: Ubiquinone biosynthesis regulatory protein kinase UbiB [Rhodanobacteraceae bacterium]|jgi:ubiquinone biosynthesis protein|nr:MAG: Ubiquinone biosynthesis regulatory protein kinase UbiB [Rhodanobacteraceae bacterium]
MTPLRLLPRVLHVAAVLVRYRIDDLIDEAHGMRPLGWLRALLPRPRKQIAALPRGARLRLALTELGPIWVKAGQVLSTRRDLIPEDVADELAHLQDQVPPFPGAIARAIVEESLGKPIGALYASFDEVPLASASIAQVHAARLLPISRRAGDVPRTSPERIDASSSAPPAHAREVVVKVLRPNVAKNIARNLELLDALAGLVERWHPQADKIRPRDMFNEVAKTLHNELNLQNEGANASLLRRNFENSDDLYVPEIFWSHTGEKVLTMERVHGIAADDVAALDQAGIDRRVLAEKGVRLFYEQVFRDNFFHADAHPGNIWVDPTRTRDPRFIALDFGIMGSLPDEDQYWLAENFIAMFERNYRRIAELHLAAGWMPRHIRVDELEAAIRTVCEPYFTRPLSEISLAEVVAKLFSTARRFELTLQPQLILLQKTLLNVEGLGRQLDPQIDIWSVAQPVLKRIVADRYSLRHALHEMRKRIPEWLRIAPLIPERVHSALDKLAEGNGPLQFGERELEHLRVLQREIQRRILAAAFGGALLIGAALVYALGPHQHLWLPALIGAIGLVSFAAAWPWKKRAQE